MKKLKIELFNDHFQNYKVYGIPKAQLVIADIPYNLGNNAYASNPQWYKDGDNKKGESELAGKSFFDTDNDFRIAEFMHFCNHMLIKEPKEKGKAPAMIVFCAFEQMQMVIEYGKKYGFNHAYPLVFIKNYSSQVLKANMKIVGATEYAVVLYRDKLPKFNNNHKMIFNWFEWKRDNSKIYPKIHPTQKPISVLKKLIEIFTDEGDVVIDPVAGSCSTLRACAELNRTCYGFEIKKEFCNKAKESMLSNIQVQQTIFEDSDLADEEIYMYKIRNDVDLNELEKFGYVLNTDVYNNAYYSKNAAFLTNVCIFVDSREITADFDDRGQCTVGEHIKDLLQAGLVETISLESEVN